MVTSWYYGDVQAVLDFLGTANLRVESDLESSDNADGTRTILQEIGGGTGGSYTLTVNTTTGTQTTPSIAHGIAPTSFQAILVALSNVGAGKATVALSADGTAYTATWDASLGNVTVTLASNSLTGGTSPSVQITAPPGNLSYDELAAVVRDGQTADALIDASIDGGPYSVPLTVGTATLYGLPVTTRARAVLRRLSQIQTAILLNEHRVIQSGTMSTDDVNKFFAGYMKLLSDSLKAIKDGDLVLGADPVTDLSTESAPGVFQSVPAVYGHYIPCDEYGCW